MTGPSAARTLQPQQSTAPPMTGMLQRKCACGNHTIAGSECEACAEEKGVLQRRAVGGQQEPTAVPPIVHEVLRSPGQPLDPATRAFFEPRFGRDFSGVRVHTDAQAAESARAVNALAFTVEHHIAFEAGQYAPDSVTGRRLLAHELAHIVQQGNAEDRPEVSESEAPTIQAMRINRPKDSLEQEADRVADEVLSATERSSIGSKSVRPVVNRDSRRGCSTGSDLLQRQGGGGTPACPTAVNFTFTQPAHVPHCGGPPLRATTNATGVNWSLTSGSAAVGPGSNIAPNGTITLAPTQPSGNINVKATAAAAAAGACFFERPFNIRTHPVGIASTAFVAPAAAGDYGGKFDHVFNSADGNVASLESVGVGERFTNVPNPSGATHNIVAPLNPFGGTFTLNTATLTPGATDNWFLTAAGGLGGTQDSVTTQQNNINVGRFVQSDSNPAPPQGLPASMTLLQGLHWHCPQRPAPSRWTRFVTVPHSRTLRSVGGIVEFVTAVNAVEQVDTYVGPTAVFNLTATPASTPRTPPPAAGGGGGGAPGGARTVSLHADSLPAALPAGQTLNWSIVGNALGCAVAPDSTDSHNATLTIGATAGTVNVQAADTTAINRARVPIVIT